MASSKKDFDKEYIFNLIMPTGPAENSGEEAPSPPRPEPPAQSEPAAYGDLALLKERISQTSAPAVQLHPVKKFVLVNLMEQLVIDRLDEAFSKFNCCRCDKCRRDVTALALNILPSHYVVTEPDMLPGLLEAHDTREISAALVKAIIQVKNHPKH